MNVRELKAMLERYPEDMEIVVDRCSDYSAVEESEWSVVSAVKSNYGYMRSHQTMNDKNKSKEKKYLHLSGN